AFFERPPQHRLVSALKLGQRELGRQQERGQRRVLDLATQPTEGRSEYFAVVERELCARAVPAYRKPAGVGGIGAGQSRLDRDQSEVHVRSRPPARIALCAAPASELLQVRQRDPGFLPHLA